MNRYRIVESPLGEVLLRAREDKLTGVFFAGQKYYPLSAVPPGAHAPQDMPAARRVLDRAADELAEYFAGARQRFTVPMHLAGTAFQQSVWQALAAIPFGATVSYGALAAELGLPPTHARAIGGAVGRNPLSVMVPCHRVLGACGDLTGYAGGTHRKRALLQLEGVATAPQLPLLRRYRSLDDPALRAS
jgi:methylated-DNA-[protein]-cysteine S-methyltransferase